VHVFAWFAASGLSGRGGGIVHGWGDASSDEPEEVFAQGSLAKTFWEW